MNGANKRAEQQRKPEPAAPVPDDCAGYLRVSVRELAARGVREDRGGAERPVQARR